MNSRKKSLGRNGMAANSMDNVLFGSPMLEGFERRPSLGTMVALWKLGLLANLAHSNRKI